LDFEMTALHSLRLAAAEQPDGTAKKAKQKEKSA
jgi:hypothetical protein